MTAPRSSPGFRAVIRLVGVLRCVDVPASVSRALGGAVRIPVRGAVNGVAIRSTLIPRGGGAHRLVLPPTVWRDLGLERGATVRARLEPDPTADDPVALPREFAEALERRPVAARRFFTLKAALQREVVRWLLAPKSATARERRLEVGLDRLEERKRG